MRLRLHVDAVRPVVELEVVYICGPEERLQRTGHLGERQAGRERPLSVDRDNELRVVCRERREHALEQRRLVRRAHDGVSAAGQRADVGARLIEHLEFEPAEAAQARNGRR